MFDRFTYRQKNYALLGLVLLMVIVSYKRSFAVTLALNKEIETQEMQMRGAAHTDADIEALQIQVIQLNKTIGKTILSADQVQQEILKTITNFSHSHEVRLDQLEETHHFQTVDFNVFSNLVSVKGTFNGILELTYFMENEFEHARLTHIEFFKKENKTTKSTELYAKMLFQNYRQNESIK